jgi:hypothetical protein
MEECLASYEVLSPRDIQNGEGSGRLQGEDWGLGVFGLTPRETETEGLVSLG